MKNLRTGVLIVAALFVMIAQPAASGLVGVYGVIERVVFEPNEAAPERVQLWGAFAFANGRVGNESSWSPATRGYLYFRLSTSAVASAPEAAVIRREWADLKTLAGTPQAIAFGSWNYVGQFEDLTNPSADRPVKFLERGARSSNVTDLRVRPATEAPAAPAAYQTNAGVVRIPADGSHADLVARLRAALRVKSKEVKR